MSEKQEIWRPIPGYEGLYEASHLGRIRSLDRTIKKKKGSTGNVDGQILKFSTSNGGTLKVRLSKDGKTSLQTPARLILRTFFREPAAGEYAAPLDLDTSNLHADNLTWMTKPELYRHMNGE